MQKLVETLHGLLKLIRLFDIDRGLSGGFITKKNTPAFFGPNRFELNLRW